MNYLKFRKNIVTFALASGLRANNIRLLKWSQIDISRKIAWIHADEAKAGKVIQVPLNEIAIKVLEAQKGKSTKWVFHQQMTVKTLSIEYLAESFIKHVKNWLN